MITNRPVSKLRIPLLVLATCCCLALCGSAVAADAEESQATGEDRDAQADKLAKAVQNSLANLITVPL